MDARARMEKLKRSSLYKSIRKDLLDQLDRSGTVGEQFSDLVEDYMFFWIQKELLAWDIRERGVTVEYDNGGGQKGVKRNDSVADLLKVNTQMMKILEQLSIKTTTVVGDEDTV